MGVVVSDQGSTLRINDGNSQYDVYKSKVTVFTVGNNVTIQWDDVNYVNYPAARFSSPSGTASAIEAAITAMLKIT